MKLNELRVMDLPLHDDDQWPSDDLEGYDTDLRLDAKFGLDTDLDYDRIAKRLNAKVATVEPDQPQHAVDGVNDESDLDMPLHMADDDHTMNFDDGMPPEFDDEEMGMGDEEGMGDEFGEEGEEADGDFSQQEEDPDFQGIIRTVKGANLVYKRKQPDDTYVELWVMNNTKDMKKDSQIRRAILAGTDINPQTQESEDGKQSLNAWALGNVQFIELTSLPN